MLVKNHRVITITEQKKNEFNNFIHTSAITKDFKANCDKAASILSKNKEKFRKVSNK